MESKLEGYRKTKRRQALVNDFKDIIYNMVSFQQVRVEEKSTHVIIEADAQPTKEESPKESLRAQDMRSKRIPATPEPVDSDSDQQVETPPEEEESPPRPRSLLTYLTYLVYFLFWVTLYAIAIELRFGVVFLMLSALLGIYFNTRTKKSPGEISAYSVFNKNCEAIDGTLKAEQFEREIGIRH
ncbi:SAYSvFN domain-containing protein 1 [Anopheles bellator]|uniref:SAYSvFN domain-containing protein 1 n=1 Tax=Anopheles bellator TaxID=139047 RepID=UPI00264786B8|nr:SAYSvFN domain-containing protein 1 [Anopheles bellator]